MPRDEVWPEDPDRSLELRQRYYVETIGCVTCEAVQTAQQRWNDQKRAQAGVHHVIRERTD